MRGAASKCRAWPSVSWLVKIDFRDRRLCIWTEIKQKRPADLLPREDAPERIVFDSLQARGWPDVAERIGRGPAETIDALNASMTLANHDDSVQQAGNRLTVGGDILWQALASSELSTALHRMNCN
jgi:hypothetical protein